MLMKLFITILLIFFALAGELKAQNALDSLNIPRPKIGLVLSGGGAKGFAHIGVLKVFDEYGIRPDYITGTSMGSIVAALYSLGYSAKQMEELVTEADWDDLLTDKISLRDIPIFEKKDYPGYPLKMFFNNGIKPSLPSGMIQGQKIQALFSKLVWQSNKYPDFDSFPIPYRCVATDIISGQAYVFKDGDLAVAMRSSMSIPTVFTPIDKDSMLLVDGGMVKNFPVQECLDMDANLIIGVYTGFETNPEKEDLQSIVKILARSSALQGIEHAKEQVTKTDLFIVPDLSQFGLDNFNRAKDIIAAGEEAARDTIIISALEEISASIQPIETIKPFVDTSKIWIDRISVEGSKFTDSLTIIKISRLNNKSHVNAEDVDKAVKRIYSTWQYNKVTYNISNDNAGQTLVFKVNESKRRYLNLGLHYDNSYGANALIKATYNNLFIKSAKASVNLSLSTNPRVWLRYKYYPTKRRRIEVSLNAYLQLNKMPDIIKEEDVTYSLGHYVYTHINFNMGLSWSPFKNVMLQASVGRQLNNILLKEGMEIYYDLNSVKYNLNFSNLRLNINTLNDPFFPTKGVYLNTEFRYAFDAKTNQSDTSFLLKDLSDDNYIITFDYKHYFLIKRRFSIIPELTIGVMEEKAFITEKFFLGGINYSLRPNVYNFGGIRSNYIATDNFIIVGIGGQYKFLKNWYLQFGMQGLFFGNNADFESESDDEFKDNTFGSWRAGIGYRSKFGPLRFVISKSPERKEFVWSVNIGVPF